MSELQLDGSEPDNLFWVRAVMLFPNDLSMAQRCFAVEQIKAVTDGDSDDEKREVDTRTLRLLLNAPSYADLKEQVAESTKRAIVAGDLLASIYLMDRFHVNRPSINKAIFIAGEYAKKAKYGDSTRLAISEPMIRKCWNDFKPVAHLWAAFRVGMAYSFSPDHPNPLALENFKTFLGVAQGMYEFGRKYIPKASRPINSILSGNNYWELPKTIPARHLQTEQMPDALMKFLKKYKAPKSSAQ